eukprot:1708738-Rhodomonas_salina.2
MEFSTPLITTLTTTTAATTMPTRTTKPRKKENATASHTQTDAGLRQVVAEVTGVHVIVRPCEVSAESSQKLAEITKQASIAAAELAKRTTHNSKAHKPSSSNNLQVFPAALCRRVSPRPPRQPFCVGRQCCHLRRQCCHLRRQCCHKQRQCCHLRRLDCH